MTRVIVRFRTSIAIALTVAAAGWAGAQGSSAPTLGSLHPGDTVRVWAVAPLLNGARGAIRVFQSDTLSLAHLQTAAVLAEVPYSSLRRVDVRRGTHRSGGRILVGTLLGAAGGLALGMAVGPMLECGNSCGDNGDLEGIIGFLVGSTVGTIAGGVTGGIIGARRTDKWVPVRLTR